MSNETITLKLTPDQEQKLYNTWKENKHPAPAYARFQLRPENCVITCYNSGKTVFQGKDALVYASPFMKEEDVAERAEKEPALVFPQAGSDEVGTGDYFGPVCVCAAYVDREHMDALRKLGVNDSKAIDDKVIRQTAPELMKLLPYCLLVLSPERYNKAHETYNINAIKAIMHNAAYLGLARKVKLPSFMMVDQFTPAASYYRYLKDQPNVVRGLHFETKSESKYPSVGAASMIARYAFLQEMDRMEAEYGMTFHKGAGHDTDVCAQKFVEKYGFEALGKTAKLHFANTAKLKEKKV
jgi:ribonuclease HIII